MSKRYRKDDHAQKNCLSIEIQTKNKSHVVAKALVVPTEITAMTTMSPQPGTMTQNDHESQQQYPQQQQWQYNSHFPTNNSNVLYQQQAQTPTRRVTHVGWTNTFHSYQPHHFGVFVGQQQQQLLQNHYSNGNNYHFPPTIYPNHLYQSYAIQMQYQNQLQQQLQRQRQQQQRYHHQQQHVSHPSIRPFHFVSSPSQQMQDISDRYSDNIPIPSLSYSVSYEEREDSTDIQGSTQLPGCDASVIAVEGAITHSKDSKIMTSSRLPVSPMYSREKKRTKVSNSTIIGHHSRHVTKNRQKCKAISTNVNFTGSRKDLVADSGNQSNGDVTSSDHQQLKDSSKQLMNNKRLAQARQRTQNRKQEYEHLIHKSESVLTDGDKVFIKKYEKLLSKKRIQSRTRENETKERILTILQKKETTRTVEETQLLEQFVQRKKDKNEKDRLRQRRLRSTGGSCTGTSTTTVPVGEEKMNIKYPQVIHK